MRVHVIFLIGILTTLTAQASPVLTMGAGIETRISQDVNPDNTTMSNFGQLYMSLAMHPWTALWEVGRSSSEDRNGNYSIQNIEYTTMVWGRFEPWSNLRLSPYFGVGLGWQFSDLTSTFGTARDTRWGDGGGIAGLGAGAMTTLFDHWNVEGEVRVAKFEMSNGPTWSVLFRSGYTF